MTLFDSHCHPQFPEYDQDRDEVIKRAQAAGVKMICVGTNIASSEEAIKLAERYPDDVWATAGIHPTLIENWKLEIENLQMLAQYPQVVAIGECGLDYYRLEPISAKAMAGRQKELFSAQIKIAQELKKPLMIHCRPSKGTDDAYEDLFITIQSIGVGPQYIVHFFVGAAAVAEKLLTSGCYFTFGGVITFARDYDEVIKFLPLERILLETDAPYVAPLPYRGQRNEPAYVIEVVKKLAEIKGVSFEKVAEQPVETSKKSFQI